MLDTLINKVSEEFSDWKKSGVKTMLLLSLCFLRKETICLYKLKSEVGVLLENSRTKAASNYKRLTRFFVDYAFSRLWLELIQYAFRLLRLKSDYLLLDGTSWERGSRKHHYLVLSVVYQGVAIPIYWEDLKKKGNSNQKERKRLIRKAKKYFNLEGKILLADREYIGSDWFKFLLENKIDFVIRLRSKNYKTAVNDGRGKTYEELEAKVLRSKKQSKVLGKKIKLEGMDLYFVLVKNPNPSSKDKVIYLLSNLSESASSIAARYPIRWKIESCFKHLKSNGFDLEKLNLKGKFRQQLLMAIIVFAYTLSVLEGLKEYKKVPNKYYSNGTAYKAISVFRKGLETLTIICGNFSYFCQYLIEHLHEKLPAYRSPKSIFV